MISELQIRLQDNYYYQRHSYEIESPVGIENYAAQVLDAIHPAGRRLFGRLVVEELSEYGQSDQVFGFIIGNLYAEAPFLASSSPFINVGKLEFSAEPVNALGMSPAEFDFLAMRVFYPHETATEDMQHSNNYYGGEFVYANNNLNYLGGLSNTPMGRIAAAKTELMPDPVLYQFPFRKQKAKLWLTGSSRTLVKSESAYLKGAQSDSKFKIAHNRVLRFFDSDWSVKIEFRPEEAVDKALIAKSGSGFYTSGTDDFLWGGSGTTWPSTLTGRTWGIGFSAARKVYVNIFDVADDDPGHNGKHTYTHNSVLDLDEYHSVLVSFNNTTKVVSLTVNGVTQTWTHVGEVNDSLTPITIGSTYHMSPTGRSLTFLGGVRNIGLWNRVVAASEYSLMEHKNYQSMKAYQKHGLLFFSNMNYPFPVDETGYNHIIEHFHAPADPITHEFDQQDNIQYRQNSKFNITEIEDITFWQGIGTSVTLTNAFSPMAYQSTISRQENLMYASMNLVSSHWLNVTPIHLNDKVTLQLNSGGAKQYNLIPDVHLVEEGLYILEFDIQNNIRSELGHVKGFRIIFDNATIAELYKLGNSYVMQNVEFSITPDGNWIHCICTLNLTGSDPNNKFWIRILTTDDTSVYDTFVSATNNDIFMRNFHLYHQGIEDGTYLETRSIPKVNGKHPSILLQDMPDGFEYNGTKLNITNKAIFCVCTNDALILDGPDYSLTTDEFISNRGGTPISISISQDLGHKMKLIRASHLDGVLEFYRKIKNAEAELVSDLEANTPAQSGNQTYTLFANCENFKLYELIVLDNPTDYEIEATTNHLINKYELDSP